MYDIIPLLVFLVIVVVYIGTQKKTDNLVYALVAIAGILAVCYFDMREKFTNYASTNHKMGLCGGLDVKDWRTQLCPMEYAGLFIKPQSNSNHKLLSETTIFTPVGDGMRVLCIHVSLIMVCFCACERVLVKVRVCVGAGADVGVDEVVGVDADVGADVGADVVAAGSVV